jgi:hypothetical protein
MSHHVKDLSADQKLAIESLLGRALGEDEFVNIRPIPLTRVAAPLSRRREIALGLRQQFAQVDRQLEGVSPDELDAATDEALGHVRSSHKPAR